MIALELPDYPTDRELSAVISMETDDIELACYLASLEQTERDALDTWATVS